jgi:hypothetical protein
MPETAAHAPRAPLRETRLAECGTQTYYSFAFKSETARPNNRLAPACRLCQLWKEVAMRTTAARTMCLLFGVALGLVPLIGCTPCTCGDSEGVLEGTWQLSGEALDPSITDFFVEFSSNGEINSISYKINNRTFDYRDAAIFGFADVQGSEMEVSVNWATGEFIFKGTINDTSDVIDGTITYEFIDGLVSIGSDLGNATLTKQ